MKDLDPFRVRLEKTASFYWKRISDIQLQKSLNEKKWTIVLGNSLAGKTRAVYEGIKKCENHLVLIPFSTYDPARAMILPDFEGTIIVVFDDIDDFLIKYPVHVFEEFLLTLFEKEALVVATCRRGNEWLNFSCFLSSHIREAFTIVEIKKMDKNAETDFLTFFHSSNRGITLDTRSFDHNIGSYFMELSKMRDRYTFLEKVIKEYSLEIPLALPREILKALKYFYLTNNIIDKNTFDTLKIKDYCERSLLQRWNSPSLEKEKNHFLYTEWRDSIKVLSESEYHLNFLSVIHNTIKIEESYLEFVIETGTDTGTIIQKLIDLYKEDNLHEYGFLCTIYDFTKLINSVKIYSEAQNILKKITQLGLKPTVATFTSLINKAGSLKEAYSILEEMKQSDLKPDEVTFNTLLKKVKVFMDDFLNWLIDYDEPGKIFSDEVYCGIINRLIKEEELVKEFVLYHLDYIGTLSDPHIICFARELEYTREYDSALTLLALMKTHSFDYYNIKANCIKHNNAQEALDLYKQAFVQAENEKQKAIALNNRATLIYEQELTSLYSTAIRECEQALTFLPYNRFPYPGRLLILLLIRIFSGPTLTEKIEHYRIKFNISTKSIQKIISTSPRKKM